MKLREALQSKMFSHFLATLLWALAVVTLALDLNSSIAVTGAAASGGYKIILLFHLWLFLLPVVCCLMLFKIRKEGSAERCIFSVSIIAILFSTANISLRFVDGFALLMKATEVIAWSLCNILFSASIYRICTACLLPALRNSVRIESKAPHDDKNSLVGDQRREECL